MARIKIAEDNRRLRVCVSARRQNCFVGIEPGHSGETQSSEFSDESMPEELLTGKEEVRVGTGDLTCSIPGCGAALTDGVFFTHRTFSLSSATGGKIGGGTELG